MAKTQKKTTEKNAATKKPAAAKTKSAASGGGGAKKASTGATTATPQAPMIDTDRAAATAAAMIRNRAISTADNAQGGANAAVKKETASFKSLKDSLSKPASQGLGGVFGNIGTQKKSGQNFGGGKQVGRNQTFGADVNRAGVPRRTGGG